MRRPNVYSIPTGAPFLPVLAEAIVSGRFGSIDASDPMALAEVTILLPTRRSARALRQILLERSPARAAILPRIRPIGDVDEEEHLLAASEEGPADHLILPPPISRLERILILTEQIVAWGKAVRRDLQPGAERRILIPASAADAVKLAGDLARLIDDIEVAGVGWDALEQLLPDDYAGYWQITIDFLKIASEQWPRILSELGREDPAVRRDQLIRASAERLTAIPPKGPIIAAGSTGSIPATAKLLKAIAGLPQGAVVLPGLDRTIDESAWNAIGDPSDATGGVPSHPQFGLKLLLAEIGIDRQEVEPLGEAPKMVATRSGLIAEAMRPATTTEKWAELAKTDAEALAGIDLISARNEQDEALAIAIALRQSLETQGAVAALVTPDRTLARRVAVELQRWNVRIDDSAGQPLDGTPEGVFVRLLAEAALSGDVNALLALTKHPLARFGLSRRRCRGAAEILEIAILRGPTAFGPIRTLSDRLVNLRFRIDMRADRFVPRARRRLRSQDWGSAEALARRLEIAIGPLEALGERSAISAAEGTELLAAALDAAADDGSGAGGALWASRAGEALAELLGGLLAAKRMQISPGEYPAFLAASMRGIAITPELAVDPRIHIWGTLEARLQSVDLMILGGLDEGVWPTETRSDAWLSRQMREAIGLAPPERGIGLAAHDFIEAMAAEHVIVSRAKRRGGSPTVASRWVQRLEVLVGPDRTAEMTERGSRLLQLARGLDAVSAEEVIPISRPAPAPKLEARPRELSITSIENLIRDPYAVYARRVLQLEPLDPIGQRADPRIRGSLIHEAFADFTLQWNATFDDRARARFLALWRHHFEEIKNYPEVHAVWLLRAEPIADWLIEWEAARHSDVVTRHAEIAGDHTFETRGGRFRLTGRADRIDLRRDGRISIFDYKTGVVASPKQVLLFQPQLALEGAMARAGGFGPVFADRSIAELAWIGLARIGKTDPLRSAVDDDTDADALSAEALRRLRNLVAAYDDPTKGYVSQARPMFERRFPGDYDHLARVAEWRFAGRSRE